MDTGRWQLLIFAISRSRQIPARLSDPQIYPDSWPPRGQTEISKRIGMEACRKNASWFNLAEHLVAEVTVMFGKSYFSVAACLTLLNGGC